MEFLEYLTKLAPEGETLLIVKQKPKLLDGKLQFHADGAIKATWPAFLPTHKMKGNESWYANTASFILDRMKDGPSAARANCEYVLVLMLDDVGTKSKEPPLAPTWVMETSPGNFQWGYAFSEQPTKGAFVAAVKAMAEAGYTDPGAGNPVRNFRLPGSINLKPGRNNFAAKLVEFHPDREFTLPEICAALGVVPGPDDDDGPKPLRLADDGDDDVAAWLSEQGLVFSRPNSEGWMGVMCPNAAAHTDGNPEGRYLPSTRAFCCLHSHCVDLDSKTFLEWVAANGGPAHTPGLREELLQATLASALEKLTPAPELLADVEAQLEEVKRREAGRVEKSKWYSRFAYLQPDDAYFDLEQRQEISRSSFNALFRHVLCRSIHLNANGQARRVEASVCYDENRQDLGGRILQGVTYAPGESVLCSREGAVFGNRWRNARPALTGLAGDVTRWMDHVELLVPNAQEREHILNVMACKLQRPDVKINHAVLHGGTQGCGKDSMWAPMIWGIGGPTQSNVKTIKDNVASTQWGYHLESEMIVIQELRQTDAQDRRALENHLKPIIAAPPEYLMVNRKGLHPYEALNRVFLLAFTNEPGAIAIDSNDRRWFVVWSNAPRMTAEQGESFWEWYKHRGGLGAVASWLQARDISKFSPGATPFKTDAKETLIERSMSSAEAFLVDEVKGRHADFATGVIGAPFYKLLDRLQGRAPQGVKLYLGALYHALSEANWADVGLLHSAEFKTKKRVFCAPELASMSKSELRRLVEVADAGQAAGPLDGLRRVK
jgi:hypothetical protein